MLSASEAAAPWLTGIFPCMASAFPLPGIVYTMMAETITETSAEEKLEHEQHLLALGELAKQTNLPVAALRRAIGSSTRLSPANLLATTINRSTTEVNATSASENGKSEVSGPITGQFVALDKETGVLSEQPTTSTNPTLAAVPSEGSPDKLQMTIEALRKHPAMTDEALAEHLALKRPASARFWRLKAIEILNATNAAGTVGFTGALSQDSDTAATVRSGWTAPTSAVASGTNGKR